MSAGAIDVWVDFLSDFHNGADGQPNGVADWVDELNQLTTNVGVPAFSAVERLAIEASIVADLEIIYAGFDISFVLAEPSGPHDVIYMGRDNDHPGVSSGNFGTAPYDAGNQDTNGYTTRDGNPPGVAKITTANFGSTIEISDLRASQVQELSTTLAGTAAHELGHTFGLAHNFVYTHVGINPSNYANTGGRQNVHIMANGSTGISESQREQRRSLSPFSQVMLEIAGGSNASVFEENSPLLAGGGIQSDRWESEGEDAGATLGSARPLSFITGPISRLQVSFLEADLDSIGSDVDVYRFSLGVDARLTAHVLSERLDLGSGAFDAVLELLDQTGAVVMRVDDTAWDDNQFMDLASPEDTSDDPLLVNLILSPGNYYLRVSAATQDIGSSANVGDAYWLVTAIALSTPVRPGDYNGDGFVDTADYTVWRDTVGTEFELGFNGADGDGDGLVGQGDYGVWRTKFGVGAGSDRVEGGGSVPEPAAIWVVVLGFGAIVPLKRASDLRNPVRR